MSDNSNRDQVDGQSAGSLLTNTSITSARSQNNNKEENVVSTEVDAYGIGDEGPFCLKNSLPKALSTIDYYQMNGSGRGQAVIINNENFHWTTGMNKRTGTDVDARNLRNTFKKLGFEVSVYKDTTCVQLLEVIRFMAQEDHTGNDCFMCAILSHGDDGCIYGTDGTIKIKSIVNQFRGNVCPSLAAKPKIFIFQACRGTQHEVPVPPAKDTVDGEMSREVEHIVTVDAAPAPTLPSGSDFLFCYSVVEGYYSHRDTLYGSWYVQDFTAVIDDLVLKKGSSREPIDFLDILTVVNKKVAARRVERSMSVTSLGKKQMSCFLSMLTKKLFLTRK